MKNKSSAIQTMFSDLAKLNEIEKDRTYRLLSGKSKENTQAENSQREQSARQSVALLDQNPSVKLSVKFLSTKAEAALIDKFARNVGLLLISVAHGCKVRENLGEKYSCQSGRVECSDEKAHNSEG